MKTTDLITDLKNAIAATKAQGNSTIPITNLENYLSEMERINFGEETLETQISEREQATRKFEHEMEVWKVNAPLMFNSVIEAGLSALKSATLINGGAAVSLLAFLGNLLTKDPPYGTTYPIHALSLAMLIFFLGVGFSGVATASRYFSQAAYSSKNECQGGFFRWLAIILALLSFGAFFYGGIEAYYAIQPVPLAAPSA